MIPGALDHFIDALQTVIRKHGIQLSLTDAAAGHSQVLITGIEDYARAAAAEFKQLLLQQETTADISMLRMVFSPEEVRVAEGPGKCHVPMLEEWFGVELLLPRRQRGGCSIPPAVRGREAIMLTIRERKRDRSRTTPSQGHATSRGGKQMILRI